MSNMKIIKIEETKHHVVKKTPCGVASHKDEQILLNEHRATFNDESLAQEYIALKHLIEQHGGLDEVERKLEALEEITTKKLRKERTNKSMANGQTKKTNRYKNKKLKYVDEDSKSTCAVSGMLGGLCATCSSGSHDLLAEAMRRWNIHNDLLEYMDRMLKSIVNGTEIDHANEYSLIARLRDLAVDLAGAVE